MKMNVFAVYDGKASFFGRPFFEQTDASAIRVFADAVNDGNPNNMWNRHPEDYSLWRVGSFDDALGKLEACMPESLVTGSAIRDLRADSSGAQLEMFSQKNDAKKDPVN